MSVPIRQHVNGFPMNSPRFGDRQLTGRRGAAHVARWVAWHLRVLHTTQRYRIAHADWEHPCGPVLYSFITTRRMKLFGVTLPRSREATMYARFTDRARRTMQLANEEALRFN